MKRSQIDTGNKRLVVRERRGDAHVPFADLRRVTVSLASPRLFDEIGFLLIDLHENQYWVLETDPEFHLLARILDLDNRLGREWYQRAEKGESLSLLI